MLARKITRIASIAAVSLAATLLATAQEFTFTCDETVQPANFGFEGNLFEPLLTNTSADSNILELQVDDSNIGNWTYAWCSNGICWPPWVFNAVDTLAPGESDTTIEIKIFPDTSQQQGSLSVTAWSHLNPSVTQTLTFTVYNGVGIEPNPSGHQPLGFSLSPAFPNPFNPATTFSYEIVGAGRVRITVFNLKGQTVRQLFDATQMPGTYSLIWNGLDDQGTDLPSAAYVITVQLGQETHGLKVLKLK